MAEHNQPQHDPVRDELAKALERLDAILAHTKEAKNGTALTYDGEELFGFVIGHHALIDAQVTIASALAAHQKEAGK